MNTIIYKNYTFEDSLILSGTIHVANSMICDSLEADTLTVTLVATDDTPNLSNFEFGTPLEYYHDDNLIGRFYVQSVQRTSRDFYKVECISSVGLLMYKRHLGGLYTGETAGSIIAEILGDFEYSIDNEVSNVRIFGHLPIATCRDNLQQVLFVTGASILKDNDGFIHIKYNQPSEAREIAIENIFIGGTQKYTAPATTVTINSHEYYAGNSTEEQELYNTNGLTVTNAFVEFSEPCHDLRGDGLTIISSDVNYAYVSGSGALYGKPYVHFTNQVTVNTGASNIEPVQAQVSDCTLVNILNAENIAKRIGNYYSNVAEVSCSVISEGEKTGDLVLFTDPFGDMKQGYIKDIDLTFSKMLRSSLNLATGWKPLYIGNTYDRYIILTRDDIVSGTWTVPIEMRNKPAFVVLFSGGNGGDGGYDGTEGGVTDYGYALGGEGWRQYYRFTPGGEGGEGGKGGSCGKTLSTQISNLAQSYEISIGQGGAGGEANGGEGSPGTHTTFGEYDTDNGSDFEGNYINLITGEIYATSGEDGPNGGSGGSVGVEFNIDNPTNLGGNGNSGEDVPPHYGGLGSLLVSNFAYYSLVFSGSGGGGASATSDGEDSRQAVINSNASGFSVIGKAGDGADAVTVPSANLASGGNGGGGGGGSGARGIGYRDSSAGSRINYVADAGTPGLGADGGDGGDGFILIYYSSEGLPPLSATIKVITDSDAVVTATRGTTTINLEWDEDAFYGTVYDFGEWRINVTVESESFSEERILSIEEATEYTVEVVVPRNWFTYTGDWKWYNDDEDSGIVELYGSGTFTAKSNVNVDLCIIGGGASGSRATTYYNAGGGAGYMSIITGTSLTAGNYPVTIGQGGARTAMSSQGNAGETSSFGSFTANGGRPSSGNNGGNGGSGGGASQRSGSNYYAGAGGSNGSNGLSNFASYQGGQGDGLTKYLFGDESLDLYCGGGGGSAYTAGHEGAGGNGGGGAGLGGRTSNIPGGDGTKYGAGGGAGMSYYDNQYGGAGYQGAVFIRLSV